LPFHSRIMIRAKKTRTAGIIPAEDTVSVGDIFPIGDIELCLIHAYILKEKDERVNSHSRIPLGLPSQFIGNSIRGKTDTFMNVMSSYDLFI
jgi:hypothetical protein